MMELVFLSWVKVDMNGFTEYIRNTIEILKT